MQINLRLRLWQAIATGQLPAKVSKTKSFSLLDFFIKYLIKLTQEHESHPHLKDVQTCLKISDCKVPIQSKKNRWIQLFPIHHLEEF